MKSFAFKAVASIAAVSGFSAAYAKENCYRLSAGGEAFSKALYQDAFCIENETEKSATLKFIVSSENEKGYDYLTFVAKSVKKDGTTTTYSSGLTKGLFPTFRVSVKAQDGVSKVSMNDTFLFYIDK